MGNCQRRRRPNPGHSNQSCSSGTTAASSGSRAYCSEPPVRRWPHLIKNTPVSECRSPNTAEIYCILEQQNHILFRICELLTQMTDHPDSSCKT